MSTNLKINGKAFFWQKWQIQPFLVKKRAVPVIGRFVDIDFRIYLVKVCVRNDLCGKTALKCRPDPISHLPNTLIAPDLDQKYGFSGPKVA